MPINIPSSSLVVKNRIRANIQTLINYANPFVKGSWIGALADSFGERVYDFYLTIPKIIDTIFPDTTIDNLDRWGSFYGISRNAATASTGQFVFYAAPISGTILDGAIVIDSNGNEFAVMGNGNFIGSNIFQTTLTRSGTTATFTSSEKHNLRSGDTITIIGASDAGFNGTVQVTIISATSFSYQVSNSIAASATNAHFTRINFAVNVKSNTFGAQANLAPFSIVTLQAPVTGITSDGFVSSDGMTGGQSDESIAQFRARLLDLIRNPVAHFNNADIKRIAKTVNGVTRVFVSEATPAAGQVTVYFMVDNEIDPVPTAAKVIEVKNKILTIKPANTSDSDVIVNSPTKVTQNFTFTALTPNTPTMRASIIANLQQFFAESTSIGVGVVADAYRSAIFSTIDLTTGEQVSSFTLSAPTGTISISAGQIAVLGSVTFP